MYERKKSRICERSFSHNYSLFIGIIKRLVIFLTRGIRVSYCTPPKFNKVSLPFSHGRTHNLLIGRITLNCVLTFFTSEYLISSSR